MDNVMTQFSRTPPPPLKWRGVEVAKSYLAKNYGISKLLGIAKWQTPYAKWQTPYAKWQTPYAKWQTPYAKWQKKKPNAKWQNYTFIFCLLRFIVF
jgi:hypothetical protein